jgi:hypothetical protein
MVFSLRQSMTQSLQLRVRRPLSDQPGGDDSPPWQLRYLGQIQAPVHFE